MTSVLRLPTAEHSHQLDSPEFAALLETLTAEFAATAEQHDRDGSFPHRNFERLHELGLLGLTVPRALGGLGANLAQTTRVIAAVARGEPSTALVLTMQCLHHASGRQAKWPQHLLHRVVEDTLRDGALINALRVEPELGTPARGGLPGTVARRTPEGWRISGRKIYSTGIPRLTWLGVWARSDDAEPLVGSWLVHRDTPGISIIETWDHLGMRATGSHEVVFDDVLVPLEHAVEVSPASAAPELDASLLLWMSVLLSAIYDAVARNARDWLAGWLEDRVPANLGAPLSSLPRFQEALGQLDALLFSNRVLLDSAANGAVPAADAFRIKYLVTNTAIQVVEKAIELSGNPGLSRANPLERHYRDVLCSRIHTPQNDTILINSGRAAFAARAARKASLSGVAGISTITAKDAS
ncbi:alkylation response protein AidB-like acyl-CoA dehydrogenase [Duganella sp. SG902]|uniref:acyl-CoA dehydrogenase family protein n=1 Tax=Duganella sp. SG902 TaxID=2587016 RepID=UPI00159CFD4A|nr:acyl-CoA dehydrogenase family protein [Duganella sp. SG902]NVM74368.1 alkylation response protein AidB-like acyl-CoA dehydrogenase [Duganella sp. SG902]